MADLLVELAEDEDDDAARSVGAVLSRVGVMVGCKGKA